MQALVLSHRVTCLVAGNANCGNFSNVSSLVLVSDYTGPWVYKEFNTKSNKFIFHNTLSHYFLVGNVNQTQRNDILEEIEKSKANYFLILSQTVAPKSLIHMVECIYKYNSDRKLFIQIPANATSFSVAAFTIQGHHKQNKRPLLPRRAAAPQSSCHPGCLW